MGKQVTMPSGETVNLSLAPMSMMACSICGADIREGKDYYACCPDCGAFICESCVKDGGFDNHVCGEDQE